jgi:hypothetical protein
MGISSCLVLIFIYLLSSSLSITPLISQPTLPLFEARYYHPEPCLSIVKTQIPVRPPLALVERVRVLGMMRKLVLNLTKTNTFIEIPTNPPRSQRKLWQVRMPTHPSWTITGQSKQRRGSRECKGRRGSLVSSYQLSVFGDDACEIVRTVLAFNLFFP